MAHPGDGRRITGETICSLAKTIARELGVGTRLQILSRRVHEAPFGPFEQTEIELTSTVVDACRVYVNVFEQEDTQGWVTISFGASAYELWLEEPDAVLAGARETLTALMEGRYEEWRRGRDAIGVLRRSDGSAIYSDVGSKTADDLLERGYAKTEFSGF